MPNIRPPMLYKTGRWLDTHALHLTRQAVACH